MKSLVMGAEVCPEGTEETVVKQIKEWKTRDAKARLIICQTLDDQDYSTVSHCQTSKDMWNTLVSQREVKTVSNKLQVSSEWHGLSWKQSYTVASFLSELKVLTQKSVSLGMTVEDEMVIAKILQVLPKKFDVFVTSWKLTAGQDSTLEKMTRQLLTFETDIDVKEKQEDSGSAFLGRRGFKSVHAKKSGNNYGKHGSFGEQLGSSGLSCWSYKKTGHIKKDCSQRKLTQANDDTNKKVSFMAQQLSHVNDE